MAHDPYEALGLSRTASADEIKKAYRRIAKTDHPDLNADPEAAARFKAASAAYDLLKDPDQRRRFDAGEIDAQGQEMRHARRGAQSGGGPFGHAGGHAGDPDLGDVFADLFGRGAGSRAGSRGGFGGFGFGGHAPGGAGGSGWDRRGEDLRYGLRVDFLTAARGGRTKILLPDGSELGVSVPQGIRDGQQIRLRGKGAPGMGKGPAGDAYLDVTVEPHPVFRREGDDIHVVLPITLDEAVLGGRVEAPTIDGPVSLTIPPGATSGQKLRLRGRGVKGGDQHVELRIAMPPRVDEDLVRFFETWRRNHGYDPRQTMST